MFKPFTCFIESMKNVINGTAIMLGVKKKKPELGQNWCKTFHPLLNRL